MFCCALFSVSSMHKNLIFNNCLKKKKKIILAVCSGVLNVLGKAIYWSLPPAVVPCPALQSTITAHGRLCKHITISLWYSPADTDLQIPGDTCYTNASPAHTLFLTLLFPPTLYSAPCFLPVPVVGSQLLNCSYRWALELFPVFCYDKH